MPKFYVLLIALFLSSCSSLENDNKSDAKIAGIWKEVGENVSAVTLRKDDGTYRRKVIQKYDYSKAPIEYESSGHWSATKSEYTFRMENVSTAIWKPYIGKQWTVKILSKTDNKFEYLSTDGAVVEEQKISGSTDFDFENTSLN